MKLKFGLCAHRHIYCMLTERLRVTHSLILITKTNKRSHTTVHDLKNQLEPIRQQQKILTQTFGG